MNIELSKIRLPEQDLRADIDDDSLDELAASMREHGQLQAIGVKQLTGDEFEVVYGARRTRAAGLNKWDTIRAEIVDASDDSDPNAKKLIENVQRESLTPVEEAYGLAALIGDGEVSVRRLQQQTGKSRDWIRSRLDILDLPEELQACVQKSLLSIGVAKALGTIASDVVRNQYIEYAIANGCTTHQATIWAGQAEFAETGQLTMIEHEANAAAIADQPQFIRQLYNCFCCGQKKDYTAVNTLVLCGPCQASIATVRENAAANGHGIARAPTPTPS